MICSSFSYPNMFDVARSKVNLYTDTQSIINRVRLLILTEPTELYMVPNFGVGLKRYMYTYNNENTIAMIKDRLIEQLRLWEPAVVAEETEVQRGAQSDASNELALVSELNHLQLTVSLKTTYSQDISFDVEARL